MPLPLLVPPSSHTRIKEPLVYLLQQRRDTTQKFGHLKRSAKTQAAKFIGTQAWMALLPITGATQTRMNMVTSTKKEVEAVGLEVDWILVLNFVCSLLLMSDLDKLHTLCTKTYKEQGVWFLNCFWEDFAEKEAETIWNYVETNATLDIEEHEEGHALDEMKAHVFLEKFDETLTVREMRAKLRSTGAIGETERPKKVPLTHYLLYKYNVNWHSLVDETKQGDNSEEMEKAERLLAEVTAAFKESEERASEARNALNAAVSAENAAKQREAEAVESENAAVSAENAAKAREAEAVESENQAVQQENDAKASEAAAVERENEAVQQENEAVQREASAKASEEEAKKREASAKESHAKSQEKEAAAKKDADVAAAAHSEAQAAQKELEEALAALHAEEKAYNDKKAELERKSTEGGVVSMNKAKNELAQHLAEDPLPLRRAKITAEAAVKRAEKASKVSADARASAEASADAASKARQVAEDAAQEASQARSVAEADAAAASKAREAAAAAREAASNARAQATKDREAAEEARRKAAAAREEATRSREAAEQARAASEEAKAAADKALDDAANKLQEAENYMQEVKSKPGVAYGQLWWIDRELYEQKKYLPVSRGGIAK
uniref:Calcium-regulated actin-bundling protein C-terminal domain-containing protein n=1 Tax=Vannella robusta TaxID=1487602 RepID=A0A6U1WWW6_9EUKA|mmetsp:Transcript_5438/g.6605  ORF Transcript_5438/g.6605 Transcript_5438/m.6605 type:complete len:617 (+) Transcript_5438:2916-4766(+)